MKNMSNKTSKTSRKKRLQAEQTWFRKKCPLKYASILKVIKKLKIMFEYFPEAACLDSSLLLLAHVPNLTLMNGWHKKSRRKVRHAWVYDLENKCHIDVTFGQFHHDLNFDMLIVRAKNTNILTSMGYSLFQLDTWSEMQDINTNTKKRKPIYNNEMTLEQLYKKSKT